MLFVVVAICLRGLSLNVLVGDDESCLKVLLSQTESLVLINLQASRAGFDILRITCVGREGFGATKAGSLFFMSIASYICLGGARFYF